MISARELEKLVDDKEILPLVKAINLDYGVKTLFSCAGHVKENPPYIEIDMPLSDLQYLKHAVNNYEHTKGVVESYDEHGNLKKDECFELLNLLMIVEENFNKELPNLHEGAGVFIGCMNITETETEFEKQLKEFNENVIDIIRTYSNIKKSYNF